MVADQLYSMVHVPRLKDKNAAELFLGFRIGTVGRAVVRFSVVVEPGKAEVVPAGMQKAVATGSLDARHVLLSGVAGGDGRGRQGTTGRPRASRTRPREDASPPAVPPASASVTTPAPPRNRKTPARLSSPGPDRLRLTNTHALILKRRIKRGYDPLYLRAGLQEAISKPLQRDFQLYRKNVNVNINIKIQNR
jgi:hypothetical protein